MTPKTMAAAFLLLLLLAVLSMARPVIAWRFGQWDCQWRMVRCTVLCFRGLKRLDFL